MNREQEEYDVFEEHPDGSTLWRDSIVGLTNARLRAQQLSTVSTNPFYVIHIPTKQMVVRVTPNLKQ
jgi:hypothetical protein